MEYVIGVDTGATKSHLALFDITGTLVDFAHWGPLNHEVLPGSFEQFKDELEQFVTRTLSKNGLKLEQVSSAVFGIAGADTRTQAGIVSQIIREIGFKRFTLANDAFLGIPAGSPDGTGICAINGTGCTLAGINKEGRMLQIGGVGYISADYGGGGMMGEKVVSTVYSELFRKGEPTCMTPAFFEKLSITSKYDFVDKIYEKIDNGSLDVAACAKMLFEAVIKNDKVASDILREIGTSYANGISCMIEELEFNRLNKDEELNIVFAGSVFVKSEHPLLLDTIKEKVKADNPGCAVKHALLNVPPVAGAVIWAFNNLNSGAYYDKICDQLRNV
ncbi:MAG: hypothetical protein LBQ89_07250 [Treponema sp.]|jgi:N-acetylglucosamine kinase-like BadF-type ATPase|nr:hypothetical protein [Treponema sp.]